MFIQIQYYYLQNNTHKYFLYSSNNHISLSLNKIQHLHLSINIIQVKPQTPESEEHCSEEDSYCEEAVDQVVLQLPSRSAKDKNRLVYSRDNKKIFSKIDISDLLSSKSTILYRYEDLKEAALRPSLLLKSIQPKGLEFDSKFECGNLQYVVKLSENEYQLILQNDTNSNGNTLWFYYKVLNAQEGQEVCFNIMNISKHVWLYNKGMRVAVRSRQAALKSRIDWEHAGEHIEFSQNGYQNSARPQEEFYSLRFSYRFAYNNDEVSFAYAIPYSYTQLTEYLHKLATHPASSRFVEKAVLCKTISGLQCEYLLITDKKKAGETGATSEAAMHSKQAVVLTARVHPGESVSSFMMKGILDFLTSSTNKHAELHQSRNTLFQSQQEQFSIIIPPRS